MHDGSLSSPPLPPLYSSTLTDADVVELQQLLRLHSGLELTLDQARDAGRRILQLTQAIVDPRVFDPNAPSHDVVPSAPPRRNTTPYPVPIPLDRDHPAEVLKDLKLLVGELRQLPSERSSWRWVVIALHGAVGHTLALVLGTGAPRPAPSGLGHLAALYAAARTRWPKLPDCGSELEDLEMIRTRFLPFMVGEWPITRDQLITDVQRLLLMLQQLYVVAPLATSSSRMTLIRARLLQVLGRIPLAK